MSRVYDECERVVNERALVEVEECAMYLTCRMSSHNLCDTLEKPWLHISTERCDSNWATPSKDCVWLPHNLLGPFGVVKQLSENPLCFLLSPLSLTSRSIVGNISFTHQLLVWSVSEELKLRFVSNVSVNVILAWSCLITTEFLSKLRVKFYYLNNNFFWVSRTLPLQWHSKIWCDVLRMKEKRWHQNVEIYRVWST